jgi:hypothetical protein
MPLLYGRRFRSATITIRATLLVALVTKNGNNGFHWRAKTHAKPPQVPVAIPQIVRNSITLRQFGRFIRRGVSQAEFHEIVILDNRCNARDFMIESR